EKESGISKNKTIWSIIFLEFVDSQVNIYKTTIHCKITEGRVGHKFGEFSLSNQ
ncbi:hypothetical protein RYX36_003154, partial [Vicia faba]